MVWGDTVSKLLPFVRDFEPCFEVHKLVSVLPKSMKLGQMTNLSVIFPVVVRLSIGKIWNSPQPQAGSQGLLSRSGRAGS